MSERDLFNRSRRVSRPLPRERHVHIALADRLRIGTKRTRWFFAHVPNGELRAKATAALLQRMGARPGVFDFFLIAPNGAHYWLELKRGLEPLSDEQDAFAAMLREFGVPYYVARSYAAAESQLKQWGAI